MMKGFALAEENIKDEVLQQPLSIHQLTANYTKYLVKKHLAVCQARCQAVCKPTMFLTLKDNLTTGRVSFGTISVAQK